MMDEEKPDSPERGDSYFDLPGAEREPPRDPVDAGGGEAGAGTGDGDTAPPGPAGGDFDLGQWLKEGWELIKPELPGYIIAAIIFTVLTIIALKLITPITYLAVVGPLTAGFFLMTVNHMHGRRPLITDLFHAFQKYLPATKAVD